MSFKFVTGGEKRKGRKGKRERKKQKERRECRKEREGLTVVPPAPEGSIFPMFL